VPVSLSFRTAVSGAASEPKGGGNEFHETWSHSLFKVSRRRVDNPHCRSAQHRTGAICTSARASSATAGLQSVPFQYNGASTELQIYHTHNTKHRSGI
jgi:hypothetical protein